MCYHPASLHFGFRPIPESSRYRQSVNRPTDHTDRANLTARSGPRVEATWPDRARSVDADGAGG